MKFTCTATETNTYVMEIEAESLDVAQSIAEITMPDFWVHQDYNFDVTEVYPTTSN